jgi:hypothetical protein
MSNNTEAEHVARRTENMVHCDTISTRVAGYRSHATAPPGSGATVQFVREPGNPHDANAIAVYDMRGQRIGYVFREIAEEYAALIDCGCVRLFGRMAAPGEPGYDPVRVDTNPALHIWVYADEARLAEILAQADAGAPAGGTPVTWTASTGT